MGGKDGVERNLGPGESLLRRPQGPGTRSPAHPAPLLPRTAKHPDGDLPGPRLLGPRVTRPLGSNRQDTATGEGLERKRVPCGLTWGGGARSC